VLLYLWGFLAVFSSRVAYAEKNTTKAISLAFLFGQNDAGGQAKPLRYAESDLEKMREVLLQNGGFRKEDIWLLRGATQPKVQARMGQLKKHVQGLRRQHGKGLHITILLYYSGHARQGRLLLGKTQMEFSEVQRLLRALDVDIRLAIVDACESGAPNSPRGLRRRKEAFAIPRLQITPTIRGDILISATGEHESAHEDPDIKGGVFTHYLISGLRGAADRDQDGKITLEELYHYTYTRALSRTLLSSYGPQRAHFHQQLSGYGSLILARRQSPQAWLLLRAEMTGDFFIWDTQRRVLLAEINKTKGKPAILALAPGRYVLHWRHPQGLYKAPLRLQTGQRLHLRSQGETLAYQRKGSIRGQEREEWPLLEPLRSPIWLGASYSLGASAFTGASGIEMAHGAAIELVLPLGLLGSFEGSLFFGVSYQHLFRKPSSLFSSTFHRLKVDFGFQLRLLELASMSLHLRFGGRVGPIFQVIEAREAREGEILAALSGAGVFAMLVEHRLAERFALSWGGIFEIGGVEMGQGGVISLSGSGIVRIHFAL
jgi:hypothetical protein